MITAQFKLVILWVMIYTAVSAGFCAGTGTLSGRIVDKITGLGLSDVSVEILNERLGTSSTKDGQFHIRGIPPGEYKIQFSSIGYTTMVVDTVLIESDKITSVQVQLKPTILQMDAITITASRQSRLLEKTP